MALEAGTLWEIRSGGNDLNGTGFYDRDPGTSIDYTQQDAAQLTLNDIATDGAGTGLSSVTGGFTAAMVGNIIQIEGDDYYEIIAFADTNNVTIDRSAGAGLSGLTGRVGGGRQTFLDAFFESMTAGDTIYVENGTYTPGAAISILKDGTALLPIKLIGYNSSRDDAPTGNDRPLIQTAGNSFSWQNGNYWIFENLRLTTSNTLGFRAGSSGLIRNCKCTQSAANGVGFYIGTYGSIYDCEAINDNVAGHQGDGFVLSNIATLISSRAFDFDQGVLVNYGSLVQWCVIDNCAEGIELISLYGSQILCNVLNDCEDAIHAGSSYSNVIMFNQFTNGVDGLHWTSPIGNNMIDKNNYYNNSGNDVTNVSKGPNAAAVDPGYTDEPGGDFSLASASAAKNIDFTTRLGVG